MNSRLPWAALVLPIALTLCAQDDSLTHAQKVAIARKLMATDLYVSEFGTPVGPEPYAHMADAQVQQEIDRRLALNRETLRAHHEAELAFVAYRDRLVAQGKTTNAAVLKAQTELDDSLKASRMRQADPTGRLATLSTAARAKYGEVCQNNLSLWDLQKELQIRTDPEHIFRVERGIQADLANAAGPAIRELFERAKRGDPDALAILNPPGSRPQGGQYGPKGSVATKLQLRIPGAVAPVNLNYAELYGPNADARMIEAVEARAISRLPAQLRQGVPRDVQLVFVYGGYEHLPAEVKQRLGASVESLRASAAMGGRSLEQEFGRSYTRSTAIKGPPRWLGVSTRGGAKLGLCQIAAEIMIAISQSWADSEYEARRQKKWADAFRRVAAEIPSGEHETVTFFEEIRVHENETIGIRETLSVNGYRSKSPKPCPAEAPTPLVNVARERSAPHPYFLFQTAKAEVIGTGAGSSFVPSEQEAFRAGCEMGVMAASATLDRNVMAATYARFNKDPKTREAYKLGYRRGSDWKQPGSPCK